MYTDTEGIVLRQVKSLGGRRIIVLLSQKHGKISAGTFISESGKSKSSLAIRPFTYGRYEINRTRGAYHINGAETLRSYYRIGENVDKFMNCSYVLEFTDKLLPEEAPASGLLALLDEYFMCMERRGGKFELLTLACLLKVMRVCGAAPEMEKCVVCGRAAGGGGAGFSVRGGGVICEDCAAEGNREDIDNDKLLYQIDFGIVNVMRHLTARPLQDFEGLALDERASRLLRRILRDHAAYHLDVGKLKSENFFR
jgi:DNA repair protein RecO (recombination protein O)